MTKLKPITNNSWIVLCTDGTRGGVLTSWPDGYMLMDGANRTRFASQEEVNEFFGGNVFNNIISPVGEMACNTVDGYPTKVSSPIHVEPDSGMPLYVKKQGSDVMYVAGYFCVKANGAWKAAMCPKLTTLSEYEVYEGPFKTELEVKVRLSALGTVSLEQVADEV